MPRPSILVADRDDLGVSALREYLARFGFASEQARDLPQLRERLTATDAPAIDLVVLDLMQPGEGGLSAARWVRTQTRVPIVILSAQAATTDRIVGLEMGADDYIAKPCEPRELVARLHSVLRRRAEAATPPAADDTVSFDGWSLHRHDRRLVAPGGELTPLSTAEFQLLSAFLGSPRRVCSRVQLTASTRPRAPGEVARSIDLLVSRLRRKLARDDRRAVDRPLIRTVRGAGYLFDADVVCERHPAGRH